MNAAARAAGIEIGLTDSYRSYEQQVEVDVAERFGFVEDVARAVAVDVRPSKN